MSNNFYFCKLKGWVAFCLLCRATGETELGDFSLTGWAGIYLTSFAKALQEGAESRLECSFFYTEQYLYEVLFIWGIMKTEDCLLSFVKCCSPPPAIEGTFKGSQFSLGLISPDKKSVNEPGKGTWSLIGDCCRLHSAIRAYFYNARDRGSE